MTELAFEIDGAARRAVTVGLDAFGPESMLLEVLLRTCTVAFEPSAGLQLGFAQSESYPTWLARVASEHSSTQRAP